MPTRLKALKKEACVMQARLEENNYVSDFQADKNFLLQINHQEKLRRFKLGVLRNSQTGMSCLRACQGTCTTSCSIG